jgi:nucleoside-diphosphate-sugar epimerase
MRVLVTGAAGFVGRWAVEGLLRRNNEVIAVSRGRAPIAQIAGTSEIRANLLDAEQIRRILADVRPDAILHCAWFVEPGRFWSAGENLDWIAATVHLLRHAAGAGVNRFVGVGTCFEYAWPADGVCDEHATPVEPTTLYAIAKDAVRRALAGWSAEQKLSFAWARLFFLYGPHEHPSRLVPSLACNLARGQPAPLSDGAMVRDFLDVRDAGDALAALTASNVQGEVNIGSGHATSLAEVADCLGRIAGRPGLIVKGALSRRPDDPPRIVASIRRLRSEVGAAAPRPLEQGLAECYAWWQSRIESAA